VRWSPALDPQSFPTSSWEIEQNENEKIMSLRSSMIERESCGWDQVEEGSSRSGRADSSSRISFSFQSRAASFLPTFSISKPALSTATQYQVPLILAVALDHPRRLPLQLSPEERSISAPFPVHLSFLPATLHIFTQPSSSSACPPRGSFQQSTSEHRRVRSRLQIGQRGSSLSPRHHRPLARQQRASRPTRYGASPQRSD